VPSGWARVRIGDVCDVVGGSTPRTGIADNWGGDVSWVTPDDLSRHEGTYIRQGRRSLTQLGYESCSATLMPRGAVVFSSRAPIGYVAIASGPVCTSQGCKSFVPLEGLLSEYLYWYLRHATPGIQAMGTGTTFKEISKATASSIQLVVPPFSEQGRIVVAIEEHFSRLDAAEATLRSAERKCQALTKSVVINAIPRGVPTDWQVKSVAETGETGLGRQRSPKYHSGTNMKPYLRVANVFEDRIDATDVMQMHFDEADFERFRLRSGDVLLNEGQSPELLGRPAIYRGEPPDVAFTNSLIRFVPKPGVTSEWALLVFRRHMHAGRFQQESRITTNIAHLALGRFRTVEFPVPPLEVQERVVASTRLTLDAVDRQVDQIDREIAAIRSLRRAVLTAAFSGRLVPQDPTDEPASVLLERIAASRLAKSVRRRRTA